MPLPSTLAHRRRLFMELARQGVPGVPCLGRYNYRRAAPELPAHTHPGHIEICVLVKGRQTYEVGGTRYRMKGGDVFLTFPGERHGTGGAPEEKGVLYWFVLDVSKRCPALLDLPPIQRRALVARLTGIRHRQFRGSDRMLELLDLLTVLSHETGVRNAAARALRAMTMTTVARAFLLEVVRCSESPPPSASGSLASVLSLIATRIEDPLSVPELAAEAGLSVAWFKARFKKEFGVPPAEYVLRTRIEEARRRLQRPGASVTRIAFDLGFSSSQYFATVFKRFHGHPPSAARGT